MLHVCNIEKVLQKMCLNKCPTHNALHTQAWSPSPCSHTIPRDHASEFILNNVFPAGIIPNVHAYTSLMSLCQRAGQWQKAMQVFRRMEAADVTVDVIAYNSAIAACAKGGDWEQAWAVFSSEHTCKQSAYLACSLIGCCWAEMCSVGVQVRRHTTDRIMTLCFYAKIFHGCCHV